ncbi:MAG: protein-glutamate O-methyltransferase CheR [Deltaproteobacteria bacterium]|nr:protein-glutamate O-methyltransferase CheR [Deltaproteobacteria bacterium]
MTSVSDDELRMLADYVYSLTGIQLDADKRYLVEGRLEPLLSDSPRSTYAELCARAKAGDHRLQRAIVDAISTHETSFFRDRKVFELLSHKIFPEFFGTDTKRPMSIWSAACSTGQEAYTVGMVLESILFKLEDVRVRILGTDISSFAVDAANRGLYLKSEIERGLSNREVEKYFTEVKGMYRVRDDLRSLCQFRVDNLLSPAARAPHDIILCRNVLIYFGDKEKKTVLDTLTARLKPDGILLVGATESILRFSPKLVRRDFRGAVYYQLR